MAVSIKLIFYRDISRRTGPPYGTKLRAAFQQPRTADDLLQRDLVPLAKAASHPLRGWLVSQGTSTARPFAGWGLNSVERSLTRLVK
ncbi:hypothetical protein [Curtobacterium pusillum]|uniref:hypothetical protein n=1 Tax=Curtobacterium pusillum TaxID=69373 RepID=UPI001C306380|nr:hypothetical protein [Curtobacterium pusillum]